VETGVVNHGAHVGVAPDCLGVVCIWSYQVNTSRGASWVGCYRAAVKDDGTVALNTVANSSLLVQEVCSIVGGAREGHRRVPDIEIEVPIESLRVGLQE
jgi:hypothetical protein